MDELGLVRLMIVWQCYPWLMVDVMQRGVAARCAANAVGAIICIADAAVVVVEVCRWWIR